MNDTTTKNDTRGDVLAYAAVGLVAMVIILAAGLIFLKVVPDASLNSLIVQIVTGVFAISGVVYGFQFGSSRGSQAKDALLVATTPPLTTPPATPAASTPIPGPAEKLTIQPAS